jgi:hypothetical protein
MASNEQSGRPGFQPIHMQILAQVDPDVDVNVGLSEARSCIKTRSFLDSRVFL